MLSLAELLPRFHVSSLHFIPQRFGTHRQPEIAPPKDTLRVVRNAIEASTKIVTSKLALEL